MYFIRDSPVVPILCFFDPRGLVNEYSSKYPMIFGGLGQCYGEWNYAQK